MPLINAPRKSKQKSIIYLTFFLLLAIPLVLYGIAQENFDIRRKAFQDLQLSDEHQCLISFPHVSPYSLQEGSSVSVQVDGRIKDDYAKELVIYDSRGEVIHSETFDTPKTEFQTNFIYTPEISGKSEISGTVINGQNGVIECQITSPFGIQGLQIVPKNTAPEFLSKPAESIPSQNLKTGDVYEYTLTAKDIDGDNINYSYTFTPRADWLSPTIIEDGASGSLTIKFKGSTNKAASYLAHVLIHDGYSKNVRSQSWVINVSPKENDIPVVTITNPIESLRIDKGVTFKTSWESTDLNQIVGHELFITNNPTNEDLWIEINSKIPYNENSYNLDTSNLNPGTYKLLVRSTDNQTPPATGIGISPEIVISGVSGGEQKRDDEVVLAQPQVINVSPSSTDEVTNRLVTVRASLIASQGTTISDDSITFKLNDKNLSKEIRINKINETEYTIIYHPEEELEYGINKVELSFKDKQGQQASRVWNFVIKSEKDTDEGFLLLFGYEIPKNIVIIVGIGLITVILALAIPFIIFTIWKGDKRRDDREPFQNDKLPPSTPKDTPQYVGINSKEPEFLKDKVKTKEELNEETPKREDVWDMYSAPKPEDLEKDLKGVKEEQTIPKQETVENPIPEPIVQEPKTTENLEPEVIPEKQLPPTQLEQPEIVEIPEPEIPDVKELQNIFDQIQQQKNEESINKTEVVKE